MRKLMALFTLGLVAALNSSAVFAGKQLYPGISCSDFNMTRSNGRLYNFSSYDVTVDCPLPHQNFNSTSGNDIDDADIGVIDEHPSKDVNCALQSHYQVGTKVYSSLGGVRASSGYGSHEQNLDFGATQRRDAQNWYFIRCTIPAKYNGKMSGITYYSAQD
jgi:hypothetical protein